MAFGSCKGGMIWGLGMMAAADWLILRAGAVGKRCSPRMLQRWQIGGGQRNSCSIARAPLMTRSGPSVDHHGALMFGKSSLCVAGVTKFIDQPMLHADLTLDLVTLLPILEES